MKSVIKEIREQVGELISKQINQQTLNGVRLQVWLESNNRVVNEIYTEGKPWLTSSSIYTIISDKN